MTRDTRATRRTRSLRGARATEAISGGREVRGARATEVVSGRRDVCETRAPEVIGVGREVRETRATEVISGRRGTRVTNMISGPLGWCRTRDERERRETRVLPTLSEAAHTLPEQPELAAGEDILPARPATPGWNGQRPCDEAATASVGIGFIYERS